ncbi:MAG: hypothetical protein ACXVOH_07120 [Bacteroidia bacterium]
MKTNSNTYDIYYEDSVKAVIMKWSGYADSEQFREGTELMLNTLIQNNCSKVLALISDMTLIGSEDQQWLSTTFIPRAMKFGFKEIAIVKPKSYFNKIAVESVSEKLSTRNLNALFFETDEDAMAWLKKATKN